MDGKSDNRRSATWIALALGVLCLFLSVTSNEPFSKRAQTYTEEITVGSAVTYASLRALNAAISFVEEVEVSGTFVIGGSANPFKFLEPIDDAVERLASAIFLVGVISAVMSVVLPIVGAAGFAFLGIALLLRVVASNSKAQFLGRGALEELLNRMVSLGGLGVLVVISFAFSSMVADSISERAWGKYEAMLDEIGGQMPDLSADSLVLAEDDTATPDMVVEESTAPEAATEKRTERSILQRAGDAVMATPGKIADAVGGATDAVVDTAHSAVGSIRDFGSGARQGLATARDISVTLAANADELIQAMIAVFAAYLFKTAVLPFLIFLSLFKLTAGARFGFVGSRLSN